MEGKIYEYDIIGWIAFKIRHKRLQELQIVNPDLYAGDVEAVGDELVTNHFSTEKKAENDEDSVVILRRG